MAKEPWSEGWNIVSGCSAVSEGCERCWARAFNTRMWKGWSRPADFSEVVARWDWLREPRDSHHPSRWAGTRRVVVSQMGDLFQDAVPDEFIRLAFAVMAAAPRHRFRILTKRSARLADLAPSLPWPTHIWAGVTVENLANAYRLDHLRTVPASLRFVNAEPLLGDLMGLDLSGVEWVVCGGESGSGARPASVEWFRSVVRECGRQGVKLWLKQLDGRRKGERAVVDGRLHQDILL
jgi:protein gp37